MFFIFRFDIRTRIEGKIRGEANVHWMKSKLQSPDNHFHNPSENSIELIFLFSHGPHSISHVFESYTVNPNVIHYQTKLTWIFQSFDQQNYRCDFFLLSSLSLTNKHFNFNQFNAIKWIIIACFPLECGFRMFTQWIMVNSVLLSFNWCWKWKNPQMYSNFQYNLVKHFFKSAFKSHCFFHFLLLEVLIHLSWDNLHVGHEKYIK